MWCRPLDRRSAWDILIIVILASDMVPVYTRPDIVLVCTCDVSRGMMITVAAK
jgi:hypothetical protein